MQNITYYFNAEHFMYVRPMAEPARLMVSVDDAERAKEYCETRLAIAGIDFREYSSDEDDEDE